MGLTLLPDRVLFKLDEESEFYGFSVTSHQLEIPLGKIYRLWRNKVCVRQIDTMARMYEFNSYINAWISGYKTGRDNPL